MFAPLRVLIFGLVFACVVSTSGCLTSRVQLPRELSVVDPVPVSELVTRINDLQKVEQLKASVSLQFADYKDSGQGKGKIYPTADGKLVLQRPQFIRMIVDGTLIGRIADMGSDGEKFAVAVYYPTERRSFIQGRNTRQYASQTEQLKSKPDMKDVSTFSKLRPQHFTLPLLVPPLPDHLPEMTYFVIESRRDEADVVLTKDARDGKEMKLEVPAKRVLRTYYVLYVSRRINGHSVPVYAYWFDRTRKGTPLVRLEMFEEDGTLSTEAEYDGFADKNGRPQQLPRIVKITRPHDNYAVRVTFQQSEINSEPLSADVFTLKNDENLRVLDLDAGEPVTVRAKASEN